MTEINQDKFLPPDTPEIWFTEKHTKNCGITFKVDKTLYSGRSKYQRIDIIETVQYGKVMLLDGLIMLTEADEFVYHEMITQIPLFTHKNPKNYLVIGGGDGGVVSRIALHPEIERITEVEIDEEVVNISKQFFPNISNGYNDKRTELIIGDGIKYVKDNKSRYDIITVDSTDPFGAAKGLFTEEFYNDIYGCLTDNGILTVQSETPFYDIDATKTIYRNLKKSFPIVRAYLAFIPTYPAGIWSFCLASKLYDPLADFDEKRYRNLQLPFKYYNKEIHIAAFALPEIYDKILNSYETTA